jgi:hypothetical protein
MRFATFLAIAFLAVPRAILAQSVVPGPAYPLRISSNGRYLVDQNNLPFLMTGDSPQALIVNLSLAEADTYLANRKAAGFNTVWVNLLCETYTGGRGDGSTYDGIVPFTTPGDLSTPNEAYFARADAMVRLAAQYGITVLLDPAETGGWLDVLTNNSETAARNYGRYLANRYQSFDNIIWLSGNDFQQWSNPTYDAVARAVALGIKDNDTRHIHTVELNYNVSESLDDTSWAPIISLNAAYTYDATYAEVLKGYNNPNVMPVFMIEASYEFEHAYAGPATLRHQEYWTMLSGATGQLYGNRYTWQFLDGWKTMLDTTGSVQMGYLKALFGPRRWYDLIPDQNHTLVTGGYGAFSISGDVNSDGYVTAAATADGALAMAYLPTNNAITVQTSSLSRPVIPRWYDPASGRYTPISTSPLPNSGSMQFSPPGLNSDGDGDWVLVLEAGPVSADFDGDGRPDIIWQDPVSGWAQVWYLGGAQGASVLGAANLTAGNTWRIVGVGDFDRDGHADVVWQDPVSGAAQVWFLGGTGGNVITSAAVLSAGSSWRIMSVADFNGDGVPDVVWQDPVSGWTQIWFMGGPQGTTVTGAVNLTLSNPWRIVGAGDFNKDGKIDLLWQDPLTGSSQIWYLGGPQGNVVVDSATVTGPNAWRIMAIADFNGDGYPDTLWQDPVSGGATILFLGGANGATVLGSAWVGGPNSWRVAGPR